MIKKKHIPNWFTFSRVLIVLPFLVLYPDPASRALWLVALLILCEATDMLDGMVARGLNAVSDFGKLLDPYADSFYRLTAFLTLTLAGVFPVWAFVALMFRDVSVAYIRVFEASHGHVRAARISGKIKAIVQGVGLIGLAIYGVLYPEPLTFGAPIYIDLTIYAVVGVTLWSLYDYAQPLWGKSEGE